MLFGLIINDALSVSQVNFPDVEKVEWVNKVHIFFSSLSSFVCMQLAVPCLESTQSATFS